MADYVVRISLDLSIVASNPGIAESIARGVARAIVDDTDLDRFNITGIGTITDRPGVRLVRGD